MFSHSPKYPITADGLHWMPMGDKGTLDPGQLETFKGKLDEPACIAGAACRESDVLRLA